MNNFIFRRTILLAMILMVFSVISTMFVFTSAKSAVRIYPTPTRTPTPTPKQFKTASMLTEEELSLLLEDVPAASSYRYDAKDSAGNGLDTIKVIKRLDGPGYIGVYHYQTNGVFNLKVGESVDLINWTFLTNLDTDASHGDIQQFAEGDFLVAYEKRTGTSSSIRIRQYKNYASLKSGQKLNEKTINRTLSQTNEGTPNFISIFKKPFKNGKQEWSGSVIKLGFHYFTGTTDKNATGNLTGFSSWQSADNTAINSYFTQNGYGGNFGDRDDFVTATNYTVYEGQLVKDRWDTWRSILNDVAANTYRKLDPYTHNRSIAFGNPTVTVLTLPNGVQGFFVSYYIFTEGAMPGEAGQLIFYTSADNLSKVTPRASRSPINWTVFSPICTCNTPGGTAPNNGFICSDGDSRYCAAEEHCTNSSVKPNWPCSGL